MSDRETQQIGIWEHQSVIAIVTKWSVAIARGTWEHQFVIAIVTFVEDVPEG